MVLAAGEEFAGYLVERVLGTGGMGAVYLAKHPRLPRRDALKLLNPAFSGDPNFRARFEREADLAAGLIHRNIVAVYDRGAVGDQLWISMQYVAGVDASIASRAARVGDDGEGSMSPHRVVHILAEVGAGLDFAHRAGLLHRDVKPANILLAAADDPSEPEHVLLTDFGIAKSTDEVQHLTGTGNLLATLAYAAPEQIEARPLDHRVDIYALGCVLYELLTGSVPFPESSPFATMTAHLTKPPPRPSDLLPWLPPGFDAVVGTAMAKDPAQRYQSCRELSLAARAALVSADPAASSPTRAETTPAADPAQSRGADAHAAAVGGGSTQVDFAPAAGGGPGGGGSTSGSAPGARPSGGGSGGQSGGGSGGQSGGGSGGQSGGGPAESVSLTGPRPPYTVSVRRTSQAMGTVSDLGPVSTNYLSATNRIALEELLHRARFFDLPPRLPLEYVIPSDVFQEITVGNAELTRSVGYEREGSRHPAELDEIIAMLERLAGWQHTRGSQALARGGVPASWTPTGTVPPLGGGAVRSTEAFVQAGSGGPGGPGGMGSGFGLNPGYSPAQNGGHPGRGPSIDPQTSHAQTTHAQTTHPQATHPQTIGPHTGPYPARPQQPHGGSPFPAGPLAGSTPVASPGAGRRRITRTWIAAAVVAVLLIAGGTTAAVLLGRSEPEVTAPATPAGLTATADGRTVSVNWSGSTGATGYTLSRSGSTVYTGVAARYTDAKVPPGDYSYTVTASNSGGQASAASGPVYVKVTDPWGAAAPVVDEFPDLLPATPTTTGYGGSTCSIASDTENSKADEIISCTDPTGVYFEVMHFPSEADKDAYLQRDWANSPKIEPWNIDGTDKGKLYRSADDEATLPYIITTFSDPSRTQYLLYTHWKDHTMTNLTDQWWKPAKF